MKHTTENTDIEGRYAIFADGELVAENLRSDVEIELAMEQSNVDFVHKEVEIHENPEYEIPATWIKVTGAFREEIGAKSVQRMVDFHNSVDDNHQIVRTDVYGEAEVAATDELPLVDERWHEGESCPECDGHTFDYRNVEDRRVESADGVANIRGMERHHGVLRVACAGCGHVVRSHPISKPATGPCVPITEADLQGSDE